MAYEIGYYPQQYGVQRQPMYRQGTKPPPQYTQVAPGTKPPPQYTQVAGVYAEPTISYQSRLPGLPFDPSYYGFGAQTRASTGALSDLYGRHSRAVLTLQPTSAYRW